MCTRVHVWKLEGSFRSWFLPLVFRQGLVCIVLGIPGCRPISMQVIFPPLPAIVLISAEVTHVHHCIGLFVFKSNLGPKHRTQIIKPLKHVLLPKTSLWPYKYLLLTMQVLNVYMWC